MSQSAQFNVVVRTFPLTLRNLEFPQIHVLAGTALTCFEGADFLLLLNIQLLYFFNSQSSSSL